ncbi:MAG TPA: hypothetical protein VE954_22365 [Oligoflexus sp.]|uniref:hypothetical protein n=1 Tax=Oligoflexus sp. TaxID=1971216 RepID=UPI002D64F29F|nr:hypothetical protein [Oligoflexus sp.]HYX35853.1 hypothetical protein [Oligoflexus sp.]
MLRAKLLAGCLLLGLSACKHPSATNSHSENLYGTDDPTGLVPLNTNAEVNLDMPDLPVRQAWGQGGQSLEVHRSATCPTESVEDNGCGNETIYTFTRVSRELKLSVCRCGPATTRNVTLTTTQLQDIDKLMGSLEMVSGPQVGCTADTSATLWELNVKDAQSVEQSYPVALCGSNVRQAGKINVQSFQALYEYLKKTLPE